ncbi:MAG: hypothetical protein GF398_07480 [Chitinivibrionales bacterium]|nr:hypothetical protein [Chitinivibrionales bacterium]
MVIPELLVPAGNFECAEAAFSSGADAVYVGIGQQNLRAHSPNFTLRNLPDLLEHAHQRGKKVYAALNTMPDDGMLAAIRNIIHQLSFSPRKPDALIVSDPGVISLCRDTLPGMPLHLSTQTGTFNIESARFWAEHGITRVVLPREMSRESISHFAAAAPCETEIFVHGAMCMSISGRCLLGAYMAYRHPNHGDCPQPCRLEYTLAPATTERADESYDIEQVNDTAYLMNSKDLCGLPILDKLATTGVHSLKIEGRNKSVHYVTTVARVYRRALDSLRTDPAAYTAQSRWRNELEQLDHRPYTTGFYDGEYVLQSLDAAKSSSKIRVVAVVKDTLADNRMVVDVKNPFELHESLSVTPSRPNQQIFEITIEALTDLANTPLNKAQTNRIAVIRASSRLRFGDILRRIQP